MSIITLTSDWNKDDYYSAAIKGRILSRCPGATIVDITSQVPAFNIALAAFQLKHAISYFPTDTIHIVAVNNGNTSSVPFLAIRSDGQYFIGYNNGIFGLLFDTDPKDVVILESSGSVCFPELEVFADAACDIMASGKMFKNMNKSVELLRQVPVIPAIDQSVINGSIIYIDSYRNAFTNIHRELFERVGKGRPFEIFVQSNSNRICQISNNYNESSPGELLVLFNTLGLLEIAINGGNAADLLNLSLSASVRVKFKDNL